MASKSIRSHKPAAPMLVFFGLVLTVVVGLWWMTRPAHSASNTNPQPSTGSFASPFAPSDPAVPGSTDRRLCDADQVKKFVSTLLAAGEVSETDLKQVSASIYDELKQSGLEDHGCVSADDVKAALYDMAAQAEMVP